MKRLLVATDFSPASDRAVEYGLKLAAALGAAVTIVAVYEELPIPVTEPLSISLLESSGAAEQVEAGLLRQKQLFEKSDFSQVQTLAVKGSVVNSILSTAEELQTDMILAGMKKRGKTTRRLFGSTITALAKKTTIPLLVVPEETHYTPPATILLGNDIRPDTDIHVLDPIKELVALYGSKLYALRVIQKGETELIGILHQPNPLRELDNFWDIKYEYQTGENIVDVLNEFARTHSIGMIVMVAHRHSIPERWFLRSYSREMIFAAAVPVLIIPEKAFNRRYDKKGKL